MSDDDVLVYEGYVDLFVMSCCVYCCLWKTRMKQRQQQQQRIGGKLSILFVAIADAADDDDCGSVL